MDKFYLFICIQIHHSYGDRYTHPASSNEHKEKPPKLSSRRVDYLYSIAT